MTGHKELFHENQMNDVTKANMFSFFKALITTADFLYNQLVHILTVV